MKIGYVLQENCDHFVSSLTKNFDFLATPVPPLGLNSGLKFFSLVSLFGERYDIPADK